MFVYALLFSLYLFEDTLSNRIWCQTIQVDPIHLPKWQLKILKYNNLRLGY